MARIITFGEIMLRLATPGHLRFSQTHEFEATFGGGEANVAVSLANYGDDAQSVEPIRIPEHLVPVDHSRLDLRDGRVRAVVDHFAWPGHRPFLDVVDTDPVSALDAEFHSDT